MTIFKPKDSPVFTPSRWLHFAEAFAVTLAGGIAGGYQGMAILSFVSIAAGFGWEVSNKWLPGNHKYGDVIDFLAFVFGAGASCIAQLTLA